MIYKLKHNLTRVFIVGVFFSGCSSNISRNELQNLPALVEIVAIDFIDKSLKIRISHRNNKKRVNNHISCQIAIKDSKPFNFSDVNVPDLTNYATETVAVKFDQTSETDLTQKLPYVLDCFLTSDNFSREQIINKSTLYQVPGKPGSYR